MYFKATLMEALVASAELLKEHHSNQIQRVHVELVKDDILENAQTEGCGVDEAILSTVKDIVYQASAPETMDSLQLPASGGNA